MLIFVVPKLSKTFKELGVPIPFTTRLIFSLGDIFLKYWYLLLILIFPLIYFFFFKKKKKRSKFFDKMMLKIPIISKIVKELKTAYILQPVLSTIFILEKLLKVRQKKLRKERK